MGNQRIILWALLALVFWFCYQTWQQDYGPKPQPQDTSAAQTAAPAPEARLESSVPSMPAAAGDAGAGEAAPAVTAGAGDIPGVNGASPAVRVVTDVLDLDIGLTGGTLRRAD